MSNEKITDGIVHCLWFGNVTKLETRDGREVEVKWPGYWICEDVEIDGITFSDAELLIDGEEEEFDYVECYRQTSEIGEIVDADLLVVYEDDEPEREFPDKTLLEIKNSVGEGFEELIKSE